MSALQLLWGASLLVTLASLPVGAVRMVAYRSGEVDHSPTMRLVAWIAVVVGLVALGVLLVTSVLLLS
jgi:hypothetical protein